MVAQAKTVLWGKTKKNSVKLGTRTLPNLEKMCLSSVARVESDMPLTQRWRPLAFAPAPADAAPAAGDAAAATAAAVVVAPAVVVAVVVTVGPAPFFFSVDRTEKKRKMLV